MAYDPKDPADKKIVDGLIADAVASAMEDATTEHDAAVAGLKKKNGELLKKIADGNKDGDAAEVARLEGELATSQKALKDLTKEHGKVTGELTTTKEALAAESGVTQKMIVDGGLTTALIDAKIPPQFLPAVKSLLASKVTIKADGDTRTAVVGDKSLGDFVKEWSQGDEGKHYVAAPANGGSGGQGPQGGAGQAKTMANSAFQAMTPADRMAFSMEGGQLTEG